ncbi:MAG: YesL family protein [Clostridia bacterium]|nr:YesL family protein [Clostridia bacterium]
MGLFDRFYYGKAGKRDYSEMDMPKTRVSLFFLVLKDHFFDLVKVNLLQFVFWIPFILWTNVNLTAIQNIDANALLAAEGGAGQLTGMLSGYLIIYLIGLIPCIAITGPSSAGAAYIMRNWARDQHAFLFSDFKDAFKGNWKQALLTSVITSLIPVLAYTAVVFYGEMASSNVVMLLPLIVVLSATLMWALMLPLIYPMMIGYELRFHGVIRNAFLMAAARLPHMFFARLVTFIPIAILLYGLLVGNMLVAVCVLLYYVFFGFALSRLVYASFANGIFDKYLNPHIEGAPMNMGLRPHTEEDDILDEEDEDEDEEDDEI